MDYKTYSRKLKIIIISKYHSRFALLSTITKWIVLLQVDSMFDHIFIYIHIPSTSNPAIIPVTIYNFLY